MIHMRQARMINRSWYCDVEVGIARKSNLNPTSLPLGQVLHM